MMQTTITRGAALAAIAAGDKAARDGLEATACPHSPAGDADARVLAQAWLRGYLQAHGRIG